MTWTVWRQQVTQIYATKSRGSRWGHKRACDFLAAFAERPSEINIAIVMAIRDSLIEQKFAPITINGHLKVIRTQCNMLAAMGYLEYNPFDLRVKIFVEEPHAEWSDQHHLTMDEVAKLLDRADREWIDAPSMNDRFKAGRLRALTYILFHTGMRAGEALWLRRDHVNLGTAIIDIRPQDGHGLKTECSHARIAMPSRCSEAIQEWECYLRDMNCAYDFLFPCMDKNAPWIHGASGYRPTDQLASLAARAGISRIRTTMKKARHTLATHMEAQFDSTEKQIQRQLRHSNPKTQQRYQHTDEANLKRIVEKVDYRKKSG